MVKKHRSPAGNLNWSQCEDNDGYCINKTLNGNEWFHIILFMDK